MCIIPKGVRVGVIIEHLINKRKYKIVKLDTTSEAPLDLFLNIQRIVDDKPYGDIISSYWFKTNSEPYYRVYSEPKKLRKKLKKLDIEQQIAALQFRGDDKAFGKILALKTKLQYAK